jgi:hypothetical protein
MAKKKQEEPTIKALGDAATPVILDSISRLLHARVGTKWDLIMVSSATPERVKAFLDEGFEPFSVTLQRVPKIDAQSKIQLVGEFDEVNVIWMKRPEILAPLPEEKKA